MLHPYAPLKCAEDRNKQTPDRLLLRSRCLEWLTLEIDEVLSEEGSEVGPCVVVRLLNVLHVNQNPHRIVDQCELLHPNLARFHLAQQGVGKDLHEV